MRGTVRKVSLSLLAVLALALLIAGVLSWGGSIPSVQAAPPAAGVSAPLAQKPDNTNCLVCHNRDEQIHQFPNGDTMSITVDELVYDQSKHANLACTTCHSNIASYPHPDNTAGSAREYTLQYKTACSNCHPGQTEDIADSAHANLPEDQKANAPTCADCHNPHTQTDIVTDENGDPVAAERPRIAATCTKCHAGIVDEYSNSVHGAALFEESNPDVPACNDCHGVHKISQARAVEFRLNSPQLCATCHVREDIMSKYNLSTDVMDTYVSDFHGTTVTLFSKERSGEDTNKPVCYDCHGVHNIVDTNDPEKGIALKENMLASCKRCHPDATENFSASWMSHYIASPEKFPLVYYVNLFYMIFIPVVLGGMGLFVLSDILFKLGITGRKNRAAERAETPTKE